MKTLRRFLPAFLLCLALSLTLLAQSVVTTAPQTTSLTTSPVVEPLSPNTDWLTSEGWQMDAAFEPLGAVAKRCRYELEPDRSYRLGFIKFVAGVPRRAYTEPIKASDIATPINGKIEINLVIPTAQRELEYWIFPED